MINETLAECLPALPEGYRWRLTQHSNMYVSRGYVTYLRLEKKMLGLFWQGVAKEMVSKSYGSNNLDRTAEGLYTSNITNKDKKKSQSGEYSELLGVTK